jgi:hypothetical protein
VQSAKRILSNYVSPPALFFVDGSVNIFAHSRDLSFFALFIFVTVFHNSITGTIPRMFCGHGMSSMNMLYREFGCDAVLCRPGTFNIHGHATLHSACRKCPITADNHTSNSSSDPPLSKIMGRTECPGTDFVHGDLNGDGILSPREIVRIIYIDTLGRFWGPNFQPWADMQVHECDLLGVTCVNKKIARIDLTNAEMCSNGERRPGPLHYCKGLPAEIGELDSLEVFQLTRRQFLRGTIPTQIGKLTKLRLLDMSTCTSMAGTIPTEIGRLTNLRRLLLSHSHFRGTIPSEIFRLTSLEKFHLTNNFLIGTLSTAIGKLTKVKEFMVSRNQLSGDLPTEIGNMEKLENFEAYHNNFNGTIPVELSRTSVKRIGVLIWDICEQYILRRCDLTSFSRRPTVQLQTYTVTNCIARYHPSSLMLRHCRSFT